MCQEHSQYFLRGCQIRQRATLDMENGRPLLVLDEGKRLLKASAQGD